MTYNFTISPDFSPDHISGWYIFNTWLQKRLGLGAQNHITFLAGVIALIATPALAQESNETVPYDSRLYPDPTFSEITPPERAEFEMRPRPGPDEEDKFDEYIQYLVDVAEPRTQEELVAWGLAKPELARDVVSGLEDAARAEAEELLRAPIVRRGARRATPTTAPTHATLFTSLYPLAHGVVKNGLTLAEDHVALAEILGARGYQTAGVVSSHVLHGRFGLDSSARWSAVPRWRFAGP